jgi:hypothetical protein
MSNAYHVPTQILASQAKTTSKLYQEDSEENRKTLEGIGVTGLLFSETVALATALDDQNEATEANRKLISWRKDSVMPRVKIALDGDTRLRHFRPGQLRSHRPASVIREGKLLVAAILRFADDPKLQKRGVTRELAEMGRTFVAEAEKEDVDAAAAMAVRNEITEKVYDLEDKLDDRLAEIERCAAAVFPEGSAARKRYRLNEIRNYIAQMHNQSTPVDPTAEIAVPDPAPEE